MRRIHRKLVILLCGIVFSVFYCEFLIYYIVVSQCRWPELPPTDKEGVLKVFMLTDLHLSGYKKGNRLDIWRRQWQMHRAFRTIVTWHQPDVVFLLGDIFDEGGIAQDKTFDFYAKKFYELFYVPEHIKMFILAGNHDVGFHFEITPHRLDRFYKSLNSTSVQLITLKGNHFVLLNSMGMHGDNCELCKNSRKEVENISGKLKCAEERTNCTTDIQYSRPILIQHFPMFRESDAVCNELDAVPWYEKDLPFTPKTECLSKEATDYLASKIKPRAVFGGHTHYGCLVNHEYVYDDESIKFLEYTIPSFSWRNIFTPKYVLMSTTPTAHALHKCGLPGEHTMVITAVLLLAVTIYIVKKKV